MSAYINSLVFIKFVWYYYSGKKYVRYLISASISILIRTCNLSNKQIGTKQLYRYVPICYYSISSADRNTSPTNSSSISFFNFSTVLYAGSRISIYAILYGIEVGCLHLSVCYFMAHEHLRPDCRCRNPP